MTHVKDGFIRIREPDPTTLRSVSTELTLQNVAVAGNAGSGGRSDTGPASQPTSVDHPSHLPLCRVGGSTLDSASSGQTRSGPPKRSEGPLAGRPGCGWGGH